VTDAAAKPRTERIQAGIWRLRLPTPWPGVPHSNAWALQRGAGLVLVDTGIGGEGRLRMLDLALGEAGFGVEDIELVVCTHAHSDHHGLALSICEETGSELWLHPQWAHFNAEADESVALERRLEVGRMCGVPAGTLAAYRQSFADKLAAVVDGIRAPDRELVAGVEIETDVGSWAVVETPGHAPSHVVFHQPDRRLMITGDHLLGRVHLFFDHGHTADPFAEYLASLDAIESLEVDLCLPGHGKPFRDLRAKIVEVRAQADRMLQAVRDGLARGGEATAFELIERIADREQLESGDEIFDLTLVLVCLDHLELRREARSVPGSDPQRWYPCLSSEAVSADPLPRR